MRQRIATSLQIALLSMGPTVTGWSQIPVPPAAGALATPVVEVIAAPTGASVQSAGAGFNSLALGHVSWVPQNSPFGVTHSKDANSFSIATIVGLRLDYPVADLGRRASIAAVLLQPDPRYVVSLDQVTLSAAPVTISPLVLCGAISQHTLSLRVPVSAPAGLIDANLGFQVTLR